MIGIRGSFHGSQNRQDRRRILLQRLTAAGRLIEEGYQEALSVPNPPPYKNSSKPGQYPRRRTGNLMENVVMTALVATGSGFKVMVGVRSGAIGGGGAPYIEELRMSGRKTIYDYFASVAGRVAGILRGR